MHGNLRIKPPTASFGPTDEKVLDYVRNVSTNAAQSAVKMLVVIDLPANLTSVYVIPKGACFVATAAYGSPLAAEIVVLSRFRARVLMPSGIGARLVRLYYALPPPLAFFIESRRPLKALVRFVLAPLVFGLKLRGHRQR